MLELGCAAGGNLIPLAMAYPEATFTGIDLSPVQIAARRGTAATREHVDHALSLSARQSLLMAME